MPEGALVVGSPFLRWAGSKRWLVPTLKKVAPAEFGSYYEPFLGSGAAFFAVAEGHRAVLSDAIPALVNCYERVRDAPDRVADIAQSWATDAEAYYVIRSNHADADRDIQAARFLYLNKLCFNGLYRENLAGRFNVPYGRPKNSNVVDRALLIQASHRLRADVQLSNSDFEPMLTDCREGDLVYLDPPYVAGHRTNGFVDYNAKIFSWDDQRRLAQVFKDLDSRGVFVVATNADHSTVRDLYAGYNYASVSRYSSMAAAVGTRGSSSELLVLSHAFGGGTILQ